MNRVSWTRLEKSSLFKRAEVQPKLVVARHGGGVADDAAEALQELAVVGLCVILQGVVLLLIEILATPYQEKALELVMLARVFSVVLQGCLPERHVPTIGLLFECLGLVVVGSKLGLREKVTKPGEPGVLRVFP